MKLLLISRFNAANIGDSEIANQLYRSLSSYFDVTKYDYLQNTFSIRDENMVFSKQQNTLLRISSSLPNWLFKMLNNVRQFVNNIIRSRGFNNLIDEIDKYDVVIIGGGNMIMSLSNDRKSISRFDKYVEIIQNKEKLIYVMDIGIGPFFKSEHLKDTVNILNKCNYITFRDKRSYNLYIDNGGKKNKSSISYDPVFLRYKDTVISYGRKNHIGINVFDPRLIGYSSKSYEEIIDFYVVLCETVSKELNVNITIFSTTKEDNNALNDVYSKIMDKNRIKLKDVNGINDITNLYKDIDLLIGTRMHSMILAYSSLVPIIGFNWQPKIIEFFHIIDQYESLFPFHNNLENIDNIVNKSDYILANTEKIKLEMDLNLSSISEQYNLVLKELIKEIRNQNRNLE